MIKYKILASDTIADLKESVNKEITMGYTPVGSVCVVRWEEPNKREGVNDVKWLFTQAVLRTRS